MQDEPEHQLTPPADAEPAPEERPEGFRRQWQPRLYLRIAIIVLLTAYAIAFVLENNKRVGVHFVFGTAHSSLIWLILLSVALGVLLGVLLSQLYRRRRRRK
ncbi:MAG TPA: lipopolysaccharide assembly protein LapA domain-containing protein [Gaiellaceae bacterium]|nr:lipopolysaccharide assembly protein LapA domain-containing protein [Gaiellaceae bacterium]